jgi:hypothetical protein
MKHFYAPFKNSVLLMLVFVTTTLFSQRSFHNKDTRLNKIPQKSIVEILNNKKTMERHIYIRNQLIPYNLPQLSSHFAISKLNNLNLNNIGPIPARVVNSDGFPIANQRIYAYSPKTGMHLFISDSLGNFVIDVNDIYKNISISTNYYRKDEVGIDQIINRHEFYIPVCYYQMIHLNMKRRCYIDRNIMVFTIPSISIYEKEKEVKSKFRFRDVKGLDERYTDIYVRY